MAETIARLDCLAALAEVAAKYRFLRLGQLDETDSIQNPRTDDTPGDRAVSAQRSSCIPTDLEMDHEGQQVAHHHRTQYGRKIDHTETGGIGLFCWRKSAALFPAAEARIGMVDRILPGWKLSDDLARGRSTFMVEMQEAANISPSGHPKKSDHFG